MGKGSVDEGGGVVGVSWSVHVWRAEGERSMQVELVQMIFYFV